MGFLEWHISAAFLLLLSKGLHLESNVTCHAIIVANSTYSGSGLINTNQCLKDCEKLRMALLKGQWECTGMYTKIYNFLLIHIIMGGEVLCKIKSPLTLDLRRSLYS